MPGVALSALVAAALAGLLGAASAPAVTASSTVGLYVAVTGSGTLAVTGGPSFTCHVRRRFMRPCTHRFDLVRGSRVALREVPTRGWKLTTWGGGCHGASATCSLLLATRRHVKATFVPPGDYLNPYRLGREMKLNAWRLRVDSASLDADAQVEAVVDPSTGKPANAPPPPGMQYTLVEMTLTYLRRGSSRGPLEAYVRSQLVTESGENGEVVYYPADLYCRAPPIDLGSVGSRAVSRRSITGYACYEIPSSSASRLLLRPLVFVRKNGLPFRNVFFALHR